MQIFSIDNPVFSCIEKIFDVVVLSVLWLITSIPIFTMGASTTALYYTVTKCIRYQRGYVTREYFKAFKSNFKQSTCIWLIYALMMGVLTGDIWAMKHFEGSYVQILQYVFGVCMVMVTLWMIYALAYTARFVQDVKHIMINSLLMAIRHIPYTFLLVVVGAIAGLIVYVSAISVLLVPGAAALLVSFILERIFVRYMSEDDRKLEAMRNHPEQYETKQNFEDRQ